jgi:hypothetical protein
MAHIAYVQSDFKAIPAALFYATNRSGAWVKYEFHSCSYNSGELDWTSIALNSVGLPGISFAAYTYCPGGDGLWYIWQSGPNSWHQERAAPVGSGGLCEYTSLAYDAYDNPHITWYEGRSDYQDLRYTQKTDGAWATETVDAVGNVGLFNSLAVDREGRAHISYYAASGNDLRYATRVGIYWTIETVDSVGLVGSYTSLALDRDGHPFITYRFIGAGDLKYAWKRDSAWSIGVVDTEGNSGYFSSLAFDSAGMPQVAYYNGNLRHATVRRIGIPEATAIALPNLGRGGMIVFPNPSVDGQFTIAAGQQGHLAPAITIFDSAGRRVRQLDVNVSRGEPLILSWDGRDDRGLTVSAGHYFVHLVVGSAREARRVTVMR